MTVCWFVLVAFAAISISHVQCDHLSENPDGKIDDSHFSDALFGFKPCVDENCGGYLPDPEAEQSYEPEYPGPDPEFPEGNRRAYCIKLRRSAIELFRGIEYDHRGIAHIKYRVYEELINHMYEFARLDLGNCDPIMKFIDLIILASNSLKKQYVSEGHASCISDRPENVPEDKPEITCKEVTSDYGMIKTICSVSTEKPAVEVPETPKPTEPAYKPCPGNLTPGQPCYPKEDAVTEEYSSEDEVEIIAEADEWEHNPIVGSLRGIPGIHYPNYTEIPITSFTCDDKKCMPGFYADLETRCQVFHVCYEHRRESFLCPIGTTFNQPILACDYWYNSNCSLAPHYYDVNEKTELKEEKIDMEVEELLKTIVESEKADVESDMDKIAKFFPVKILVTETKAEAPTETSIPEVEEIASEIVDKMATTATKIVSSVREVVKSIPEPQEKVYKKEVPVFKEKPLKFEKLLAKSVMPLAKAKLAAIPVSKATALKTTVPLAAKTKVATKIAIPAIKAAVAPPLKAKVVASAIPAAKAVVAAPLLAKTKVAAMPFVTKTKVAAKAAVAAPVIAKAAAVPAIKIVSAKAAVPVAAKVASVVPKVAIKSSIPVVKAKKIVSTVPLAKTVPVVKAKVVKGVAAPLLKAKVLSLPLAKGKLATPVVPLKVKLAKAAAISPLTKKALALGYMKLLKAKKIGLMG